ncbi:hypothetical protein KKP04_02030 [Rhodomicrobium sp. Az07]|uniref:hypothetical protein n=1 Tax=Rhodomicrobium sp. Az07 TaxID=2839034 RepID=UPI001BE6F2AA|nr:hypothetical protein [Rhodomicrobium sp. Az07]MBT3069649.1 hypothetical protein [Rhodomicrobium sp. Az07]
MPIIVNFRERLSIFWNKYVAAEEEHAVSARARQKRIDDVLLDVVAREAVRKWENERLAELDKDRRAS